MARPATVDPDRRVPNPGTGLALLLALALVLVSSACTRPTQERTPPPIVTSEDLRSALRQAGAQVQASTGVDGPPLGVPAGSLSVDGAEILVYEYATQSERKLVSLAISEDPATIRGTPVAWPRTPRIWVSGRLIIAYLGSDGGTILLLNSLLGDPLRPVGSGVDEPYPPAVAAAIEALAAELGVDPASIEVTGYEPMDWPDACLGLPGVDERCAEVVTAGWLVALSAGGRGHEAHTDMLGTQVRLK